MKEWFLSWGALICSVLFNVYGIFVIKLRLNDLGPIRCDSFRNMFSYFLELMKSPLVVSGLIFFFIAPFLFAVALSRLEITAAYPAQIGLNFLFLFVLALLVLGEQFTLMKGAGIFLVALGVYFLQR